MIEKWKSYLDEFRKFVQDKNWQIITEKEIDHGYQVIVTDGIVRLCVNFFHTGKITPQGKPCETRTAITECCSDPIKLDTKRPLCYQH